ncbi:MAG: hypothetical protein AAF205_00145 [Pseudomonadota bacterium]
MDINAAFPSKYLKAADILGQTVNVNIRTVLMEEMGDGAEKPVIYFQGKEKGVVMNRTNAEAVADAYGANTEAWAGQVVQLYTEKTRRPDGQRVDGIRMRPLPIMQGAPVSGQPSVAPSSAPQFPPPPAAAAAAAVHLDDDIPF